MTINSEETINPKTLKAARKKQGLSQQDLAAAISRQPGKNMSAKAIYRYESGKVEAKPSRERAKWLADALRTTVADLCKDPEDDEGETSLGSYGYIQIRQWLRPDVALNYRLVEHHFGVPMRSLIDAAPWMFTLLAEESLADRKRRIANAKTAFDDAMARLPDHLGHVQDARSDLEHAAYEVEEASIDARDIFGQKIFTDLYSDWEDFDAAYGADKLPFNSSATNPFVDFLYRKASEIGSDEITENYDRNDYYDTQIDEFGSQLPNEWPVFQAWFYELTGWDRLAQQAVTRGYVQLGTIPQELLGAEKRAERVAWLIDHIPDDVRARLAGKGAGL